MWPTYIQGIENKINFSEKNYINKMIKNAYIAV